nr:MAG TPA: antitoxin [Caudoviricetes sp.]
MRVQFTVNDQERLQLETLAKSNGYPDISSYCKDKALGARTYHDMWETIKIKISDMNSGDIFSLRDLIDAPPSNLGVKVFNNQDLLGIEVLPTKDSLKTNRFKKK